MGITVNNRVRLTAFFSDGDEPVDVGDPVMFSVCRGSAGSSLRGDYKFISSHRGVGRYEVSFTPDRPGYYRFSAKSPSGAKSQESSFRVLREV